MSQFEKSTASVAAWNLSGFDAIADDRVDRQVEGLSLLDAEIIALVEINPIDVLDKIKDGLKGKGVEYESLVLPQNDKLHLGVLFKKGVTATNARFIPNSDLGDPAKRQALAVDMKVGKFDFTLIIVHLKSGRGTEAQGIRNQQCQVIGQYIKDLKNDPVTKREDILLMGDFNMIPGQDITNFYHLGADEIMDFVSSWDLQQRYSHILEVGRENLLDGFAISRKFSTEYIKGSLRLFPMHWNLDIGLDEFRETVSDHLPFVASFRIDRSRD